MQKVCSYCGREERLYKVRFGIWDGHGNIVFFRLYGLFCHRHATKLTAYPVERDMQPQEGG